MWEWVLDAIGSAGVGRLGGTKIHCVGSIARSGCDDPIQRRSLLELRGPNSAIAAGRPF